MNSVPCLSWIPRGIAKTVPFKLKIDKDELKQVIEDTRDALHAIDSEDEAAGDDEMQNGATARATGKRKHTEKNSKMEDDDIMRKYDLDDYDDEDNDFNPLSGIGCYAQFASNEDDPYVTAKHNSDSEDEDFEIQPTDNLIVAGRAQKDHCLLEVYVYNEDHGQLFVHHEYFLPTFPLTLEWMNINPSSESTGNFVAVGSMEPVIEIWNLDVVDSFEPDLFLGEKKHKKKKKKKLSSQQTSHTDAVLDLSWNTIQRNILASASADFTVGLWDLLTLQMATSINQHSEKVQCVQWHPHESESLLTGSFDKTVKVFDCRSPNDANKTWQLEGEVERVLWDHFSPVNFYATNDKGTVFYLDMRQDKKPVFTLAAHNEAVTGLSLSTQIAGLLVTTSSDKNMKVWDVQDNKPSLVLERNLRMNELLCVSCCPEAPFVFAFGGDKDLKVWDIRESAAVRKHFQNRMPAKLAAECEGDEGDVKQLEMDVTMETLFIDNDGDISVKRENSNESGENVKRKKKNGGKTDEQHSENVINSTSEKKIKKKKKKKKKSKAEALEL
ncbi:periodic tryptophan protein 1 homolog [Gigantopelta aegis]|uniref:periodic tryptophan protein 1 homolog n=1 Tax=Gigantopelta aegis TaxID=1735272 RepID=UPI001B88C638|nr:periodic tryptophan protein 1 homolog [Gigantopelta aegis]